MNNIIVILIYCESSIYLLTHLNSICNMFKMNSILRQFNVILILCYFHCVRSSIHTDVYLSSHRWIDIPSLNPKGYCLPDVPGNLKAEKGLVQFTAKCCLFPREWLKWSGCHAQWSEFLLLWQNIINICRLVVWIFLCFVSIKNICQFFFQFCMLRL